MYIYIHIYIYVYVYVYMYIAAAESSGIPWLSRENVGFETRTKSRFNLLEYIKVYHN